MKLIEIEARLTMSIRGQTSRAGRPPEKGMDAEVPEKAALISPAGRAEQHPPDCRNYLRSAILDTNVRHLKMLILTGSHQAASSHSLPVF